MVAMELVADRHTKAEFDPAQKVIACVTAECESRGMFARVVRDTLLLAPPLVIKESEVDRIVGLVREGIASMLPERV
jgi:adenosylmethionine-8-amino-7-oxononanoate aminotransferase